MESGGELGVNSDAPAHAGCILSGYLEQAMAAAHYDKLDDGSYAGRIPMCKGVIAFAPSLAECKRSLRSTLEDWLLLGLKLGHALPVLSGINLNGKLVREPLDAL